MKRIILMALLAMALPLAAFADTSIEFTSSGGTLAGSSAGLSLSGSTLIGVNGLAGLGLVTGDLGGVTFTTGTLTGDLQMGGSFAAGGSFVITGNGTNGVPNTTIFTGSFSGPVTWTLMTLANGTHQYTLAGTIQGTMYTGQSVVGSTILLTVNTGKGFFNGSVGVVSSDTGLSVPEPGTLGLLGTGLIGLAGVLRRKVKS